MHKNTGMFFASHKKSNEVWHTEDGHHFFSEGGADAHGQALKKKDSKKYKGTCTKVTRAEWEASKAEGSKQVQVADVAPEATEDDATPAPEAKAGDAEKWAAVSAAMEKVAAAQAVKDAETASTPAAQKTKNTKVLNEAKAELASAQAEYDAVKE